MSRGRKGEGPTLFDLPLAPETPPRLATDPPAPEPSQEEPRARDQEELPAPTGPVGSARLRAALADLLAVGSVGVGVTAGLRLLDIQLHAASWSGVAVMLLVFAYLYSLLPLAFWGQTPGMAWAGVRVATEDGSLPSFAQAHRIFVAGLLTGALAGLPALLLLSGRSLGDRWSGCRTHRATG